MADTTNLILPLIEAAQAQKHVTVNETLLKIDGLLMLAPKSGSVTSEPTSPADGDVYILPPGKTGANWGAAANYAIAHYRDGVWQFYTPREGFVAFVKDIDVWKYFDGTAWGALSSFGLQPGNNLSDVASAATARGNLGLGTAAVKNTGTSGDAVPLLNAANTFSERQSIVRAGDSGLNFQATAGTSGQKTVGLWMASDSNLKFLQLNDTFGYTSPLMSIKATGGVEIGAPSGGNKGAGTLNANAVYDDNTLLTCAPIAHWNTDVLDLKKWDSFVPDRVMPARVETVTDRETGKSTTVEIEPERVEKRRHAVVGLYKRMVDEGFDPRNPENFVARMKQDGAVPGLMTEAEWAAMTAAGDKPDIGTTMTRTHLALDCLAVAFAGLLARLEQLEAARAADAKAR